MLVMDVCWRIPSLYDECRLGSVLFLVVILSLTGVIIGVMATIDLFIFKLEYYHDLLCKANTFLEAHAAVAEAKGFMHEVRQFIINKQNNKEQQQ